MRESHEIFITSSQEGEKKQREVDFDDPNVLLRITHRNDCRQVSAGV